MMGCVYDLPYDKKPDAGHTRSDMSSTNNVNSAKAPLRYKVPIWQCHTSEHPVKSQNRVTKYISRNCASDSTDPLNKITIDNTMSFCIQC